MTGPIGHDIGPLAARLRRTRLLLAAIGFLGFALPAVIAAQEPETESGDFVNPLLGDEAAIKRGRRIYRGKCIVCLQRTGGRAKNLFKTRLTDEQFLMVVINGREGTLMPSFASRMGLDDVWEVHAYVKSSDHYY